MSKIKSIVIEDEKIAQNRLIRLLDKYPEIEVIATANNGKEGAILIDKLLPDFIFLDIQMPILTGFEMLKEIKHKPKIIFTTAYDQFALQAFEENSIDYLLKPINEDRLDKAINKLLQTTPVVNQQQKQINALLETLKKLDTPKKPESITFTNGDKIIMLPFVDIAFFEAEDKYAFAITLAGKRYITDLSLTKLEEKTPEFFIRIHRSIIINTKAIIEIRKSFNGKFFFKMEGEKQVESGVTYNRHIKAFLGL